MTLNEESSPITTVPDTHWIVRTEDNDEQSVPERMLRSIVEEGSNDHTSTTAESDADTSNEPRISPSKRSTKPPMKSKKSVVVVSRKTTTTSNKKMSDLQEKIHTTRAATRSSGNAVGLFKGIEEIVLPPKPRAAPKVAASNDNVIKIPMLTGTLYMYRDGPKRRVKFVRTK